MPPVGTRPETDVTLEWHEGFSRMSPDRGYSATHRCTLGQPISGHRVRARWQAVSKCYLSFSFFFFFFFFFFCLLLDWKIVLPLPDLNIRRYNVAGRFVDWTSAGGVNRLRSDWVIQVRTTNLHLLFNSVVQFVVSGVCWRENDRPQRVKQCQPFARLSLILSRIA